MPNLEDGEVKKMTRHRVVLANRSLCVGCGICTVACKQEHNLPVGVNWMRIVQIGPKMDGDRLVLKFTPMRCVHCARPDCMDACTVGAITKRSDGLVLIDENKCTGCKLCIETCPYGAIQFDEARGIVGKCDMCVDLIDKGLEPSCVKHCMTRALLFKGVNQFSENVQRTYVNRTLG